MNHACSDLTQDHKSSQPQPTMRRCAIRKTLNVLLAGGLMGVMLHLSPTYISLKESPPDIPVIYFITPTYSRPTQKADLTRLGNTLRQVPNLHWIVVEDTNFKSPLVVNFLLNSLIEFTHLNITKHGNCTANCGARGAEQRNFALDWLRQNRGPLDSGVVYFGDDDNSYDLELFEEMRYTKRVSVWPVGLIGSRWYERPLVRNGRVVGWYTGYPGRKFNIDMAGFAVNLNYILANPAARFAVKGRSRGQQETNLLSKLTKVHYLEPKANNCTKVLVWHTRTEKVKLHKHVKENVAIEV